MEMFKSQIIWQIKYNFKNLVLQALETIRIRFLQKKVNRKNFKLVYFFKARMLN